MGAVDEACLIARLESSDYAGVGQLLSSYLDPFSAIILPKNRKKKSQTGTKVDTDRRHATRSLAKQFLPFITRALSILPKRLSEAAKSQLQGEDHATELLNAYKISLRCLECISSELACKPYSVQAQSVRMIHCFEAWGRYNDAEVEGLVVLKSLRNLDMFSKSLKVGKTRHQYVPYLLEDVDDDLTYLVVEVVVTLVKCAAVSESEDDEIYQRVLVMVDEVSPWLRALDANKFTKMNRILVTYLHKCTLFIVEKLLPCHEGLVRKFCLETLSRTAASSTKDQIFKFVRRISSSLFSQKKEARSCVVDLLSSILCFTANAYKVKDTNSLPEFLDLVSYCVEKSLYSEMKLYKPIAVHLNKLASDLFQDLALFQIILRVYATRLHLGDYSAVPKASDLTCRSPQSLSFLEILLSDSETFQSFSALADLLQNYAGSVDQYVPNSIKCSDNDSNYIKYSLQESEFLPYMSCDSKNRAEYMYFYFKAVKLLCQPLSELLCSEKKYILEESEGKFVSTIWVFIQDVLSQICVVSVTFSKLTQLEEREMFEISRTLPNVVLAAFILSLKGNSNVQRGFKLIKHMIRSQWIQPQGLKFVYVSLHNVGVILYRKGQLSEASKALKLSNRASWTCVLLLCRMFAGVSKSNQSNLSEAEIVKFFNEAILKNAIVLDVVYQQHGNCKLDNMVIESLESWIDANKLCPWLPCPASIVKQWVNIKCKNYKRAGLEGCAPTLYHLLASSSTFSEGTIGMVLEQELLAYEMMNGLCPRFCHQMQMEVTNILLHNVYITGDTFFEKSKILIKKGRVLRALGGDSMKESICCLTEAAAHLNSLYHGASGVNAKVCHWLAFAYYLRAVCTQESEPNSKEIYEDIHSATNLWMNMRETCFGTNPNDIPPESILVPLFYIVDLLSLKGCTKFHHGIFRLMLKLFKMSNVSSEKCLAFLWEFRRFQHALCFVPMNEEFLADLSDYFGECSLSMEFWLNCLKENVPLSISFQQYFSTAASADYCSQDGLSWFSLSPNKVKDAASCLISTVPLSSHSVLLSSYLYYDLSDKLISAAKLVEALLCAKEAHKLRSKLLQENFSYSLKMQDDIYNEGGEVVQKRGYSLHNLQLHSCVATAVWSFENASWNSEACKSPWKILQCYIESILQVGIINEMIGNDSEAEILLLYGKQMSHSQGLIFLGCFFSCSLGKLYRKKHLWDEAEKELYSAKELLSEVSSDFCCLKCSLMLEVTIDYELGNVFRFQHDALAGTLCTERLNCAKNLYNSCIKTLNLSHWKNSVSCPERTNSEGNLAKQSVSREGAVAILDCTGHCQSRENHCKDKFPLPKTVPRRSKRTATVSKKLSSQHQPLASENKAQLTGAQAQNEDKIQGYRMHVCDYETCIWNCLVLEVINSGYLRNFIYLKWELIRRRLLSRLLASLGKCARAHDEIHGFILQSLSALVARDSFFLGNSSKNSSCSLEFVETEILADPFVVERAAAVYNICWFSLKYHSLKNLCYDVFEIPLGRMFSWLALAFVLCREVPFLVQKVSRLLVILIMHTSSIQPSLLFPGTSKMLSENYWASFFHQASLDTDLNYQMGLSFMKSKEASVSGPFFDKEMPSLPRLEEKIFKSLEAFVQNFFSGLPCSTVICISMLGDAYVDLVKELFGCPLNIKAWMLVSRMSADHHPITVLVPVGLVLEGFSDGEVISTMESPSKSLDIGKHWHCPWDSVVINDVAPAFKVILEENYASSSIFPLEDTRSNRVAWWAKRKDLDEQLSKFLKDMEDLWFGPWKYLLLGEWSKCRPIQSVLEKLLDNLKSKFGVQANVSVLKVVLEGAKHFIERDTFFSETFLAEGCFVGSLPRDGNTSRAFSSPCSAKRGLSEMVQLILETANECQNELITCREPVILVLDREVQMLPWESMPILRSQEVYRMPSVASISAAIDRRSWREQSRLASPLFPSIDPLDAFYLLNPSGDLGSTQLEFENWFKQHHFEGVAGVMPTSMELTAALRNHDLFIYFGHGSGSQYISGHEIQKLENCAATFLMGCCSGSLSVSGCYPPRGAPLYYLLAGSPVIVANLWEVTDKDIDRFGKSMLQSLIGERSNPSEHEDSECGDCYMHKPRIGCSMCHSRDACLLPFLIGAAPVCYGIPTGIGKKAGDSL